MADGWDWGFVRVLSVSHRDNKYYVFDGEYRPLAAKKRSDIQKLPCPVFEGMSLADEANAFLGLNTIRAPGRRKKLDKARAFIAASTVKARRSGGEAKTKK